MPDISPDETRTIVRKSLAEFTSDALLLLQGHTAVDDLDFVRYVLCGQYEETDGSPHQVYLDTASSKYSATDAILKYRTQVQQTRDFDSVLCSHGITFPYSCNLVISPVPNFKDTLTSKANFKLKIANEHVRNSYIGFFSSSYLLSFSNITEYGLISAVFLTFPLQNQLETNAVNSAFFYPHFGIHPEKPLRCHRMFWQFFMIKSCFQQPEMFALT